MFSKPENMTLETKLISIAKAVLNKINSDIIDTTYTMRRLDIVASAILADSYKKMYMEAYNNNPNIKGIIRPKVNSWIGLISNGNTEVLDKFGMTPYNNTILENIAKRIELEINTYKNTYMFMVRNYIKSMKEMVKTITKDPILENSFTIQLVKEAPIVKTLEEKGWLNNILGYPSISEINGLPVNMENNILDIKNDLEIKVLAEETFKTISDGSLNTINSILSSTSVTEFMNKVFNLRLKDINALLGLIIIFRDKLKELTPDNPEYGKIVAVFNYVNNKYRQIKASYDSFTKNKAVVIGLENKDNTYIIYALEDIFNEYINDKSGSLKTIIGSIFYNVNVFEDVSDGIYEPLYIRFNDLIINKDKYNSLRDTIQNSLILKNRNETASKLRAYYLIAFDNITKGFDNKDRKGAEAYINSRNLSELYDFDNSCLEIIEHFGSLNTNFHPFSEAMEEAEKLLKSDDLKYAAGYAALKLILLYLVNQTEIV